MTDRYIFSSERLGFRNWTEADIPQLCLINADPKVMEFFPALPTTEETEAFVERMQKQFTEKGFCYYAVDRLDNHEFIGFIGISEKDFEEDFTPCVDIGWRLSKKEWGKGYATEGAKQCLGYAFKTLKIRDIYSLCPVVNTKSELVMQKIGMKKIKIFDHPALMGNDVLNPCVLYKIEANG